MSNTQEHAQRVKRLLRLLACAKTQAAQIGSIALIQAIMDAEEIALLSCTPLPCTNQRPIEYTQPTIAAKETIRGSVS